MNSLIERFDKILIFIIVYTLTFIVFFRTLEYTLPFVLAFICALAIRKPTEYLSRKFNLKKSVSSLITTFIFFSIIVFLLSWGVTQLAQEAIALGKNSQFYINLYMTDIIKLFDNIGQFYNNLDPAILAAIENNFSSSITKLSNAAMSGTSKIFSFVLGIVASIPYILMVIVFTLLATYFFTKDISLAKSKIMDIIPDNKEEKFFSILAQCKKMLFNYILSYGAVISLTFAETLIVFLVLKIKYAFILSLLCAIFDILPILGMGAIYVPLALVYMFLFKNFIIGIVILIAYVVIIIIRQIVEPKIVSASLGVHPVAILAAIFIGLKANGFSGMVFCIFLVVFYTVLRKVDVI